MSSLAYVKENKKNLIPAVTHIDGTARFQTVNNNDNPETIKDNTIKFNYHDIEKWKSVLLHVNKDANKIVEQIIKQKYESLFSFSAEIKKYILEDLSKQIENEIDVTDGKADKNKVLKQRNTFIGISGDFGKLFIGTHDTAFKKSQLKVDLFNDSKSDIKNLFVGENRSQDLVGYTSPELIDGLKITLNNIKTSSKNYQSYAFNYNKENFKSSLGFDSGLKGFESKRFALTKTLNKSTLGFLYQESINSDTSIKESGYVMSLKQKISSKSSLMFQTSNSDIKLVGGEENTIGYSYQYNSILKLFTSYSKRTQQENSRNKTMISAGFELKF